MKTVYKIIIIAIGTLIFSGALKVHAQVNTGDSLALVDLYNNTHGPGWANNTNWLSAKPVSTWYGVRTSVIEKELRVDTLKLDYNHLTGIIVSSFGNLTKLKYLNLSNDHIRMLPESFGALDDLAFLDITENGFTDSIPACLYGLASLTFFYAVQNDFTGTLSPAISNLSKLEVLDLSLNRISGNIPPEIGNMVNLVSLTMESNKFTGTIPGSIGNLVNLVRFKFDYNQLSGQIPAEIGNCSSLLYLQLYDNLVTGIPATIGNLSNLDVLDVSHNKLTGNIQPAIGKCIKLSILSLWDNQLTGSIPASFGKLTSIYSLRLNDNKLTGSIPASLGNLKYANSLELNNNLLTGKIPPELGRCIYLNNLILDHNQLSGAIPDSLANIKSLWYLQLNNNQLTGKLPSSLVKCYGLKKMDVSANRLSGGIPRSYRDLHDCVFIFNDNELSSNILKDTRRTKTRQVNVQLNRYNFTTFESPALSLYLYLSYSPQKTIPVHQSGNTISVTAGGTLNRNTYSWYKNGTLVKKVKGDSSFITDGAGTYWAVVKNDIVTLLTLYSDTITITVPIAANKRSADLPTSIHHLSGPPIFTDRAMGVYETGERLAVLLHHSQGNYFIKPGKRQVNKVFARNDAAGFVYFIS